MRKLMPLVTAVLTVSAVWLRPGPALAQNQGISDKEGADRELLRQKMEKLKALEQGGRNQPAAPVAPVVAPAPGSTWTPEMEAKIRQALDQSYADIEASKAGGAPNSQIITSPTPVVVQPPAIVATPKPEPAPAPAPAPIPVEPTPAPALAKAPEPEPLPATTWAPETEAQIRVALDKAYADIEAGKTVATTKSQRIVTVAPPAPAPEIGVLAARPQAAPARVEETPTPVAVAPAPLLTTEPAPAQALQPEPKPATRDGDKPPMPLDRSKQKRLADLLQLYKTDKITPREYQEQRAKIMGADLPAPPVTP